MTIIDSVLWILGLGLVLWIIFGLILPLFIAGKYIADDPNFVQFAELPDADAMAKEGWELTYSAEDNDYHMLAQVYSISDSSRYRVILCDTNYTGGVQEDMECDSYLEAKELAEELAYSYQEEY